MWSGPDVDRTVPASVDEPASRGRMGSGPDVDQTERARALDGQRQAGVQPAESGGGQQERATASIVAQGTIVGKANEAGIQNVNGEIVGQRGVQLGSQGELKNVAGPGINGRVSSDQGNVQLNVQGSIQNEGTQLAGRAVEIEAGKLLNRSVLGFNQQGQHEIRNTARVTGQDQVSINTVGDAELQAAQVQGRKVSIQSSDGKVVSKDVHVVNAAATSTTRQGWLGYEHTETIQASARSIGSEIEADRQGGTLNLQGKQGVELVGGRYSADKGSIGSSAGELVTKAGQNVDYDKQSRVREQFIVGASGGLLGAGGTASYGSGTGGEVKPESDGQLVSGRFGYERKTSMDTTQRVTHQNAQLDFGRGVTLAAEEAVDIGGTDIQTLPQGRISVSGKSVRSTKAVDEMAQTHAGSETFVGIQLEVHSSVANVMNGVGSLIQASQSGQSVAPGLTTLQAVGHVTDLAFNDTLGGSVSATIKHTQTDSSLSQRRETVNHVRGGTIEIASTKDDIALAGVKVEGHEQVALDSAGALTIRSAQEQDSSSRVAQSHQVSIAKNVGTNAVMQQAYVSETIGYSGTLDKEHEQTVSHRNSEITGTQVTLKSREDATLMGTEVEARQAMLNVGGKLTVEGEQDRRQQAHESGRWGATVGGAMGLVGGEAPYVAPVFSVQGDYGKDYDNSQQVVRRAGVRATEQLDVKVQNDLTLSGAELTSGTGMGQVKVSGKTTAQTVEDTRDKDGGNGGGSVGFGKDGLASVTLDGGRVAQVHYRATQASGVNVKDFESAGGVEGALRRDSGALMQVTRDEKIAGNDISLTLDDLRGLVKRKTGGEEEDGVGPVKWSKKPAGSSMGQDAEVPAGKGYAQRVIVQQGDDVVTTQAAKNLANKHPDNTTLVKAGPDGKLEGLEQIPAGPGKVKVQVVGHGDGNGGKLGDADAPTVARQIESVKARLGADAQVEKVTLVGCQTACTTDAQPSLKQQVQAELAKQGTEVGEVKGRDDYVKVDVEGRKLNTIGDDPEKLGKLDMSVITDYEDTYELKGLGKRVGDLISEIKRYNTEKNLGMERDVDDLSAKFETVKATRNKQEQIEASRELMIKLGSIASKVDGRLDDVVSIENSVNSVVGAGRLEGKIDSRIMRLMTEAEARDIKESKVLRQGGDSFEQHKWFYIDMNNPPIQGKASQFRLEIDVPSDISRRIFDAASDDPKGTLEPFRHKPGPTRENPNAIEQHEPGAFGVQRHGLPEFSRLLDIYSWRIIDTNSGKVYYAK
ncbi:hypothetical protein BGV48_18645 [Burkholderia ubonensis]|nr:hypothetical protein BGV48_18645 [Burkholderia ubonensis]